MNEPIQTFFDSVESAWARALLFFGACWLGHAYCIFTLSGFGWDDIVASFATMWMTVVVSFVEPWGILYFPFLVICFYLVMFTDRGRFHALLALLLMQPWHTAWAERGILLLSGLISLVIYSLILVGLYLGVLLRTSRMNKGA